MKRLVCMLVLVMGTGAWAQQKAGDAAKDPSATQDKKRPAKPSGEVNWAGPIIKATGSGAPDMRATSPAQARLGAETAAKLDAFRNLLSQAKGLQVSAGKTVGEAMEEDVIRGRVEGIIRGYKVTARRYYSDSGVELDVEVPLGAIVDAVKPTGGTVIGLNTEGPKKHTGVIVDARSLTVAPVLSPRLLDESGAEVYAAEVISDDVLREQGVASYFASLDEAKKSERVGDKPLVIKALRTAGADLVLSADTIKQLKASNQSYLAEGRVAIVSK